MRTRTRTSLHLGLNYGGTTAELAGCATDARDWYEMVGELGYTPTVVLEPSKAAMLGYLRQHVASLRYGDRLLVTYSGHGTWLPDTDGDEPDGRDEALVPADFQTSGLLLDDELLDVWAGVPFGARVVFVSDSCHSGSVTRFAALPSDVIRHAATVRDGYAAARYLPPAQVLQPFPGPELRRLERAAALPVAGKPRPSRVALLSGCADTEVSYDAVIAGKARGAASWAYLLALRAEVEGNRPPPSLSTWHKLAARLLATSPYAAQHPQLSATRYQAARWTL